MISPDQLPPRITEYLGSYYTTVKTLRLADRYKLSGNKLDDFAIIINGVFLQNIELKDFPKYLRNILGLPDAQAYLLAAEVSEQHFAAFEDFLGGIKDLTTQWQTWGHEFGGKEPGHTVSPKIERMMAQAGTQRGPGLEFKKKLGLQKASPIQTRPNKPAGPGKAPPAGARKVPMPVTTRRPLPANASPVGTVPMHATSNKSKVPATQAPGVSRDQFLKQLEGFKVESLRTEGQSAGLKISQLDQQLATVLAGAPQDRPKVQNALRRSPLVALYQEQGQDSIRFGKALDVVIYERYQSGKPYLLKEEFEAVAKLMKSIQ